MRIELADEADLPAILAISNWAAEHTFANFATEPEPLEDWRESFLRTRADYPWLVARTPEVIGFAKASPWRARGAYRWAADVAVYLAPAHHRTGVGSRLYRALFALLRAQGFETLIAGIAVGNVGSERLHERFGFKRCATLRRVGFKHGAWRDVGYWELHLGAGQPPTQPSSVAEALARVGPLE